MEVLIFGEAMWYSGGSMTEEVSRYRQGLGMLEFVGAPGWGAVPQSAGVPPLSASGPPHLPR